MTLPSWKRPESVLVVVYTTAGDVLLMERTRPAGFWQSVTGSLQWGEAPAAAARRELHEETGLDIQPRDCQLQNSFPIVPEWRARYEPGVLVNLEHVFAVELDSICPIQLSGEHRQYIWLAAGEALSRCTSWTNADAIRLLCPAT